MSSRVEHRPAKVRVGYEGAEVTKPPNWHDLVAFDLLFNNLTTGLFLAAALAELAAPASFAAIARLAYPIALIFLLIDLACLVFDLGRPTRFHHMLRVFKPTSPMSLGTWSLTAYSLPLSAIVAVDLAMALGWLPASGGIALARKLLLILNLLPALGSAAYKGVLFSTSSQPGWKDARWLGGYLVNSALLYGTAGLLALAIATGRGPAVEKLRLAAALLAVSNLIPLGLVFSELHPALAAIYHRRKIAALGLVVAGLGLIVPIGLLASSRGSIAPLVAIVSILLGGMAFRVVLVKIPHRAHGGDEDDPS